MRRGFILLAVFFAFAFAIFQGASAAATNPSTSSATESITLKKGSKGDDVQNLQLRLIQLGYLKGKSNGSLDSNTEKAIKAFQKASSLVVDGIMEKEDLDMLTEVSREFMKRAAVVAMTNGQAADVFKRDGNTYDTAKFHKYSEMHDAYLSIQSEGVWSEKENTAWHIDSMLLKIENYELYIKVSMDIRFDGKNYIVSNVSLVRAELEYLDSDDSSRTSGIETMEPSKNTPFLTVSPKLVKDDRKASEEEALKANIAEKKEYEENRKDWIGGQFSIWDGTHKELEKLIKNSLNDEKSYDHIETTYTDISYEGIRDDLNQALKDSGYKQRLKMGDLFIVTEFSAKNSFGATVKGKAYGIARFDDNTITLIGIE